MVDYLTFVYKFVTLNFNFQPQLFSNRSLIFNYPPPMYILSKQSKNQENIHKHLL